MTTYYSDQFTSAGVAKYKKELHAGDFSVTGTYSVAAAITSGDVFVMVPVAAGCRIKDVTLSVTDLDTGTSLVLDVGDTDATDDLDRYIDGTTTTSISAGVTRMNNQAGHNYKFAADGTIDVDVETAPQTSATTGTITVTARMTRDTVPQ